MSYCDGPRNGSSSLSKHNKAASSFVKEVAKRFQALSFKKGPGSSFSSELWLHPELGEEGAHGTRDFAKLNLHRGIFEQP